MKKILYINLLIISVILSACNTKEKEKSEETEKENAEELIKVTAEQFNKNNMKLDKYKELTFAEFVNSTGNIDVPPAQKQIVTSFYGGTVKKSGLLVGDYVRKGQFLVSLESPEFVDLQQEFLETKEKLDYLQNEYTRQKTLFEEKITSKKKFLFVKSEYLKNLAMYNGLKQKLLMLNINPQDVIQGKIKSNVNLYAKINGYVTRQNASVGIFFEPNDKIMELINPEHLHVELNVFEKDAMKIKKGQKIIFHPVNSDDQDYYAQVHLVGPSISPDTKTIKIHGHIENEKNISFPIGMFVDAQIIIKEIKALGLPQQAITENELEEKVVLILVKKTDENYYFKPVKVKTGREYKGNVEIISDIKPGTLVLTKGAFNLVGVEAEEE